jgi:hypothetical protein
MSRPTCNRNRVRNVCSPRVFLAEQHGRLTERGTVSYQTFYRPHRVTERACDRYVNMDYIFFSSLAGTTLDSITVSYDIACQWSKNLKTRMERMPTELHLPDSVKLKFCVPKFHLPAHVPKCWAPFSFNFASCVGRTDGEGVERMWSTLNGVAHCVSMMGQGGRMDTLDDFCNDHNWLKTTNTGEYVLLRCVTCADSCVQGTTYCAS